jgi:hypothetical protein
MTESEREQEIDRRVQRILATDSAYRNAENAEEQAERERHIEDLVIDALDRDIAHARAMRRAYGAGGAAL